LAGQVPGKPALLAIPATGLPLDQARARLQELDKAYPRWRDWLAEPLPDAVAGEVRGAAAASYRNLLPAGREAVLAQLQRVSPDGRETAERWRQLRDWAASPPELKDWRELATLLARLADPRALDPVTALADFLRRDRFDLELQTLTVTIPDDVKVRPVGKLT